MSRDRVVGICSLALLIACAGCGAGSSSTTAKTPTPTTVHASPRAAEVVGLQPSVSARMVCEDEGQKEIASSIGMKPKDPVVGRWSNQLYACDYIYSEHEVMALSVKELRTTRETDAYFDALGTRLGRMQPLQGLGQGAYQTANGSTVVRKDNLVLLVDVSGLPAQFGVPSSPKADVSLSVAATIMGCWSGE